MLKMIGEIFNSICVGLVLGVVAMCCVTAYGCKVSPEFNKNVRRLKVEIAMDILSDEASDSVESMLESVGLHIDL